MKHMDFDEIRASYLRRLETANKAIDSITNFETNLFPDHCFPDHIGKYSHDNGNGPVNNPSSPFVGIAAPPL
jgi:hypothetical protein